MTYLFILYDERAVTMGTENANVECTADTLSEARRDVREMFPNAAIYRYEIRGKELVNEAFIEHPATASGVRR